MQRIPKSQGVFRTLDLIYSRAGLFMIFLEAVKSIFRRHRMGLQAFSMRQDGAIGPSSAELLQIPG